MRRPQRLGTGPGAHPEAAAEPAFGALLAAVRARDPQADAALVERAYAVADHWHHGQKRKSGRPYITHPVAVATIVADLGMDHQVVCAALLHDLLEDTAYPADRLGEEFGEEIADLVAALADATRVRHALALLADRTLSLPDRERAVLVLKLADRLHNIRTVRFLARATQLRKAQETLDIQAPAARALGLDALSSELKDLASATLRPPVRVRTVSQRVLAATTLLLPPTVRARWLEEWIGELATLPTRPARTRFTARVLLGIPRLSLILHHPPRSGDDPW
jgi:GTP pyrophosphokinase